MIALKALSTALLLAGASACQASAEYAKQAADELAWTWGQLQAVMSPAERATAKTLKLSYLKNDRDAMRVRLLASGVIEFSAGTHIRAQEFCTMAEYVRLLSAPHINKEHLLSGYNGYLAEAEAFGPYFLSARAYLERVDDQTDYTSLYAGADDNLQVAACRTGLLAFLLAHEFAHALSADPVAMDTMPADEVNELERKADAKALDLLARTKTFPIIGMFQFFLVANHIMHEPAQTEYSSFDHPLPYDRILDAIDFTIANFDKYLDENDRKRLGASLPQVATGLAGLRAKFLSWKAVQEKYDNTSAENDGLQSFAANDATYAIRVPSVYLDGTHGTKVDLVRARVYFTHAVKVLPASFYYQQAAARHGAGMAWSTGPNPQYEHACAFFAQAADMHLLAASKRLKALKESGNCK